LTIPLSPLTPTNRFSPANPCFSLKSGIPVSSSVLRNHPVPLYGCVKNCNHINSQFSANYYLKACSVFRIIGWIESHLTYK
jgi:hypothetical protein